MAEAQINESQLEHCLGVLEMARSWSPRVMSRLEAAIRSAADGDLFRFNPVKHAARTGMAEGEAIALFLHGTRAGLFDMDWNMVCGSCGHMVESLRSMGDLHSHYVCEMCFGENEATLDDLIHVTFTVKAEIRRLSFHDPLTLSVEDYYFGYRMSKEILPLPNGVYFNDVLKSLTKLLTYLEPGETRTLELEAAANTLYRVSDLVNSSSCAAFVADGAETSLGKLHVVMLDGKLRIPSRPAMESVLQTPTFRYEYGSACQLPPGPFRLEIENRTPERASAWVVLAPGDIHPPRLEFDQFLSGKRVLTDPTYRELFGHADAGPLDGVGVRDITLLLADLDNTTELCGTVGDPRAFHIVRQHAAALSSTAARHAGAHVKMMGDTVMIAFADPADAVRAVLDMMQETEERGRVLGQPLQLKIGVHRGHALAASVDNALDYFGQAVNMADRIRRSAEAGELCVSRAVHEHPGVSDLLDRYEAVEREIAGMSERVRAFRLNA